MFASDAKSFAIGCALLLLVFLPAVFGISEFLMGIPDFKNLPIWRIKAVSSDFSKVPCKNSWKN